MKSGFMITRKKLTSAQYVVSIAVIFSVIIAVSLAYNIRQINNHAVDKALVEANAIFDLNLAYRLWNAGHGGVYVPVTPNYQPSPYLAVHPKRDITGTDGTLLTVVNPAIMTRNVHEILSKRSSLPIMNKVTSLKYFNPDNKPDEWEEKALQSFEAGKTEASEIVMIKGRQYMRLMKPYYTEEGCLKCHAWQGYKVGDVRGGLSVGVPMQPHLEIAATEKKHEYLTHAVIWLFGISGIGVFGLLLSREEKKTLENEWKFRTLAESATDWEYWISDDEKILFMSPSSLRITGYDPAEFEADPSLVSRIIHPDDAVVWTDHICSRDSRNQTEVVFRIATKTGETKWLSHVCSPIISGKGMMGRRVCSRDITERVKSEEALRRWAHIFEHAEWGVVVVAPDGETLELMNPAFAALHGYSIDELVGRSARILFPPDALAALPGYLKVAYQQGHNTFQSVHVRKDGSVFPVQCDMTVVRDEGGKVLYLVVNVQNLTEQKKLEAQLIQAQKMQSIGRLAAGIAHDFNNYLSVINGYGEMLLMTEGLDEVSRKQIQTIFDAGTKAAVITRQLLAFSRKQVLEMKPASLTGIVNDIMKILDKMVGEDIKIHPRFESKGIAMIDRSQIEQVIINLVVNARDAMPRGGSIFIETHDRHIDRANTETNQDAEEGDYVVLSVADTGEGMTKEVMDNIFEPFFTTKQLGHGTGLGLATVQGIVKQHRGHLFVSSELGKGSTFSVYLPRTAEPEAEAAGTAVRGFQK